MKRFLYRFLYKTGGMRQKKLSQIEGRKPLCAVIREWKPMISYHFKHPTVTVCPGGVICTKQRTDHRVSLCDQIFGQYAASAYIVFQDAGTFVKLRIWMTHKYNWNGLLKKCVVEIEVRVKKRALDRIHNECAWRVRQDFGKHLPLRGKFFFRFVDLQSKSFCMQCCAQIIQKRRIEIL